MKFNFYYFRNKIISLNESFLFPLILAILSFCIWIVPSPYNIAFGVLYCILAFVPLFTKEGKSYLPLLLFLIPASSIEITISSIPLLSYFLLGSIFLSMIIKIIIYKMPLRKGELSLPLLGITVVYLISFIFNIIINKDSSSTIVVLYLVGLLFLILLYAFLSTTLGQSEMMSYLSKCIVILTYIILSELLTFILKNDFSALKNVSLGWAKSNEISTILCLSTPFFAIIISNKKEWYYIFTLIPILAAIVVLVVDSGILFLLAILVPLLLITYKSYGKIYPYISLVVVASFAISFALLLVFNEVFTNQIFDVFRNLFFVDGSNIRTHIDSYNMIQLFTSNLALGSSISSIYINGELVFASNTIISTMVLGGIVGLVFYLLYEIRLYLVWFRKKADIKYIFLMFLIGIEVIGIVDDIIYSFINLLFILICNSCYQNSSRPDDVIIHNDFFLHNRRAINNKSITEHIKEL